MTAVDNSAAPAPTRSSRFPESADARRGIGRWGRFILALVITAIVLVPVIGVLWLSLRPGLHSQGSGPLTLRNFAYVLGDSQVLEWLTNSLTVTLATTFVSVLVAAPAGYALSRGRGRVFSGYSLVLFVVQSLPVITAVQ